MLRPAGPAATLSATLVYFGTVRAGSSLSRTVTLTNAGTSPVQSPSARWAAAKAEFRA